MVKKTIIFLSLLILLLTGAFSYLLFSKSFLQFIVKKTIESRLPDTKVRSFNYKSRKYKFPGELSLKGVTLDLQRKDQSQVYRWQVLTLVHQSRIFDEPRKIRVLFEGLDADISPVSIRG